MRNLAQCLLPWKKEQGGSRARPGYHNIIYVRRYLISSACEIAIYTINSIIIGREQTRYEYHDWWKDGSVDWGFELSSVKSKIDAKLVKAGFELLTEEEAERLKPLL